VGSEDLLGQTVRVRVEGASPFGLWGSPISGSAGLVP
jgi:hypothetical protein